MIRVTKTIVKKGVAKSYSMLCEESQVESLLKDSRFTLDKSQVQIETKEEPKEDTNYNDFSSNKKKRK